MLTIDGAANRLSVSTKTIRNLIKSGKLAHHRIGAGRGVIRISEAALSKFLEASEVGEHDSPTPLHRRERRTLKHLKL